MRFLEQPSCRVLVCDRADEEGLNLQGGAKAIIRYDLPMAPNRIEQRIGRLDRYGSGDSVRSYVLCCSDDPYQQSWSKCLIDAVGVFSRSIASLQYLIDAAMQQVRSLLLTESHEAMSAMTARLGGDAGEVTQELRRIDHQDALDALGKRPEDALDELFSIDSKWRDFQTTVDDWLVTCLEMSHAPGPSVGSLPLGDSVARYALQRDGRHPTLIPLSRFVGTMLQSLDKTVRGTSFKRPLTYANNDSPLSDILVRDLTAHRTLGLRLNLSEQPDLAVVAVTHSLASQIFYLGAEAHVVGIQPIKIDLAAHADGIEDTPAGSAWAERHANWARQMPRDVTNLWTFVAELDHDSRMAMFAHCVALTVNALKLP